MESNRAPRVDYVTANFFRSFWRIIGHNVINVIHEFALSGVMPSEWKDTLVVLLPKVPNVSHSFCSNSSACVVLSIRLWPRCW